LNLKLTQINLDLTRLISHCTLARRHHSQEFALDLALARPDSGRMLRCTIVPGFGIMPKFIRKNLPCGEKTTAKNAVW